MKMLEQDLQLRVSECDANNMWRPGAMLTEMQELAGMHSHSIGCGRETLLKEGLAWVVVRMELQIHRYPAFPETVKLRTFCTPPRHRFFPRYFQAFDKNGEQIMQASSMWLLMDLETRQSVSAERLPSPIPENDEAANLMAMPGGIDEVDCPPQVISHEPVYTDLDANGHVNNTRYVDWLCNALGMETMKDHPPERLIIHYDNEIRPGTPVELRLKRDGARFQMTGIHDGRNAFDMGGILMGI